MTPLLDRHLLFVTGKGGVGKTTVAAALGLACAERGRRTIVCELSAQERIPAAFGRDPLGSDETEVAPNLFATSIDPSDALREWLATQLGSRSLVEVLTRSNGFQYFVAAAPGARELVAITKVWELAQQRRWRKQASGYDTVIVDAPSSGHALGMLRGPRTFADIARVGPIARQANQVADFLVDPDATGYVAVALPAEMPVSETLELERKLLSQQRRDLDAVIVNAVYPRRFSREQIEQIDAARNSDVSREGLGALAAARSQERRVQVQQSQLRRLRREASAGVVTLPFVFETALEREHLEILSRRLARRL